MQSIEIPNSVTSIGDMAFWSCGGLESIVIPESVISIGHYAFANCWSLETIEVSKANPIYRSEQNCLIEIETGQLVSGCKSSIIPSGVASIGEGAFYGCSVLTGIQFPNSVVQIGEYAFYNGNLQFITFAQDSKLETIEARAFYNCGGFTSIEIPEGVTKIGEQAFFGCDDLTRVAIPDSIREIKEETFASCVKLKDIDFGSGVTTLGFRAFYICSALTSIFIPENITSIDGTAFETCSKLESFVVDDKNEFYSSYCGILYNKNKTIMIAVPRGIKGAVEIPTGCTAFCHSAFYGCEGLTSIEIPDSITTIDTVFYYCSNLTNITIHNTIVSIKQSAFAYCEKLTEINFDGTIDEWQGIEKADSWAPYSDYTVICTDGTIDKDGTEHRNA